MLLTAENTGNKKYLLQQNSNRLLSGGNNSLYAVTFQTIRYNHLEPLPTGSQKFHHWLRFLFFFHNKKIHSQTGLKHNTYLDVQIYRIQFFIGLLL